MRSSKFVARPNTNEAPLPPAMSTILSNCIGSENVPYGPSTEAHSLPPGFATAYLCRSRVKPSYDFATNSTGSELIMVKG